MSIDSALLNRSGSKCELCRSIENLNTFPVDPDSVENLDKVALLCEVCSSQILNQNIVDVNHWRCLNDSMWSQVPAVQVLVWRMLTQLRGEGWPQDLLDMLYLDEDLLNWAQAGIPDIKEAESIKHLDSNGAVLESGDTVTLIKDLVVKGANFTAKRGTAVRGISLVEDNLNHIEGRVNGQRIVILTKFVKKSN